MNILNNPLILINPFLIFVKEYFYLVCLWRINGMKYVNQAFVYIEKIV